MEPSKHHPIDCGVATTSVFPISWEKQLVGERSFDILNTPSPRITQGGEVSSVLVGDINYARNTGATFVYDYNVTPLFREGKTGVVDSFSSKNTNIANNNNELDTLFSHVTDGSVSIVVSLKTGEKNITVLDMLETTNNTVDEFLNFADGSAIKHSDDTVSSLKNNTTEAPLHYAVYSTYNNPTSTYTRNTACWLASYDFSGVCVKTGNGGTRMCVAITPWHALGINHFNFHPRVGEVVEFCTLENTVVSRVVDSVLQVGTNDCVVVKFTEALPENIKKYKMFAANSGDYFPKNREFFSTTNVINSQRMNRFPVIICSHFINEASYPLTRANRFVYLHRIDTNIFDSSDISPTYGLGYLQFFLTHNKINGDAGYSGYSNNIIGGDSGGPIFGIINNELILLSNHIGPYYALNLCKFLTEIQSTINTLGPSGQTIQTVDLSGFTDFSS